MKKFEVGVMVSYALSGKGLRYYITIHGRDCYPTPTPIARDDAKELIKELGLRFVHFTRRGSMRFPSRDDRISSGFFHCPENSAKFGYKAPTP